jgi:hypothetical protein
MRKLPVLTALAISALSLSTHSSEAQGYAPWPPPPGMTAGEYAARYGHRITPDEYAGRSPYHGGFERGYGRDVGGGCRTITIEREDGTMRRIRRCD